MKRFTILLIFCLLSSCASERPRFVKENVCSNESLKYLKNPRNRIKRILRSPELIRDIANSTHSMQRCYEEFKDRTGQEEFNTCLVVGVDEYGRNEFYNFSSRHVKLDQSFMECADNINKKIPFEKYGKNYILIQSYKFYVGL